MKELPPTSSLYVEVAWGQLLWFDQQGGRTIAAELSLLLGYQSQTTVQTVLDTNRLIRRALIECETPREGASAQEPMRPDVE